MNETASAMSCCLVCLEMLFGALPEMGFIFQEQRAVYGSVFAVPSSAAVILLLIVLSRHEQSCSVVGSRVVTQAVDISA